MPELFESTSPDNHSQVSSGRVDRLLAQARREPDEQRRTELYQRAEAAILDLAPVAPLGYFETHWVAQPDVENIQFDVLGGFDAVGISLDRS